MLVYQPLWNEDKAVTQCLILWQTVIHLRWLKHWWVFWSCIPSDEIKNRSSLQRHPEPICWHRELSHPLPQLPDWAVLCLCSLSVYKSVSAAAWRLWLISLVVIHFPLLRAKSSADLSVQTAEFDNTGFLQLSHIRAELLWPPRWFIQGLRRSAVSLGFPSKSFLFGVVTAVRLCLYNLHPIETLLDYLWPPG